MHGPDGRAVLQDAPEFERAQRAARRLRIAAIAVGAALLSGIGGYVLHGLINFAGAPVASSSAPPDKNAWVAAAPGRVEASSGEIRLGAAVPGRIARVLVHVDNRVEQAEVVIRLEDEAARARLASAAAELATRQRERDTQGPLQGREDLRKAEDAAYAADRAVVAARAELDAAQETARRDAVSEGILANARSRLAEAQDRRQRERAALAEAQAKPGLPATNRAEAALTMARATMAAAQAQFDNTRIRSPIAGTVLQFRARVGETLVPSPDAPTIIVGDLGHVLVKADVEERDVGKLKVGQSCFVRSGVFADRQFEGKVTALAPALEPARAMPGGPNRPEARDVLRATIELDGEVPLRPGQRVDVFFRQP